MAYFITIAAFQAITFIKPAIMPSIDSGSLDSINLPLGFKIDIFADELDGSPVLNKSHSLDFYDLLYFDPWTRRIVKEMGMNLVKAVIFFELAISRFRSE